MTDLEISKALALAIGWKEEQIDTGRYFGLDRVVVCLRPSRYPNEYEGKYFDYRDWNVIGPIAEKFDCFPIHLRDVWNSRFVWRGTGVIADTPQKAIALAVIGAKK
jgi:hypothetical protein